MNPFGRAHDEQRRRLTGAAHSNATRGVVVICAASTAHIDDDQPAVDARQLLMDQPRQKDPLRPVGERGSDVEWRRIDLAPR